MIMATLLISTLVTEGLAAVSGRKDDEAAKKEVGAAADGGKTASDVRGRFGGFDYTYDDNQGWD